MKKISIALFSTSSVHAPHYINSLPLDSRYNWVASSVAKEDRGIPDLKNIPNYVKIYEREEDLLNAHPDLDAVILCGSNNLTFNQFKLCAERGIKNVILMKIPTMFINEYEEMQRLAKENDMIVQIELEMRANHTVKRLKKLCEEGAIGNLLSIQINNTTVVLPPNIMPWVTNPELSYGKKIELIKDSGMFRGGCLTDHPHPFDLARFLTGSEFESIYAQTTPNIRGKYKIEEGVFVACKMKNGVCVTIDPSYSRHESKQLPLTACGPGWEGYPKRVEVNVVLNGDKGSIIADCFHSGVYHTGLPHNTYAYEYLAGETHYETMLDYFYNSIVAHTTPYVNLDLHKNNIKAIIACYESIYCNKKVCL